MYGKILLICVMPIIIVGQNLIDIIAPKVQNSKRDFPNHTEFLVTSNGYMFETYDVITEDKYILKLYRIVNPLQKSITNNPIVIFGHGLCASSDYWLVRGRDEDLAFLLADNNYDVWLINYRGNGYSKRHVFLKPTNPSYWDFSFHEMGLYDLPNSIDFILEKTGQKSVMYIGHSMGTTIGYVTCSTRPEYNSKFRLIISLGAVIIFKHRLTSTQRMLITFYPSVVDQILMFDQRYEILPYHPLYEMALKVACSVYSPFFSICKLMYFSFCGPSRHLFNSTILHTLFQYYPSGNSIHTVNHYYNNLVNVKFLQRDYGPVRNLRIYNQSYPPEYPLEKITANVALYYGATDDLSTIEDNQYLASFLSNLVLLAKVNYSTFNHGDFLFGNYVKEILYKDILKFMDRFR